MNKTFLIGVGLVVAVAVGFIVYFGQEEFNPDALISTKALDKNNAQSDAASEGNEGKQVLVNDIESLDRRIDVVQERMQNLLKNKITIVEGEDFSATSQVKLDDVLRSVALLSEKEIAAKVPIPPESPSGKVLNQPRTASGISMSMLNNYQNETGVTPQEIEDLMQQ